MKVSELARAAGTSPKQNADVFILITGLGWKQDQKHELLVVTGIQREKYGDGTERFVIQVGAEPIDECLPIECEPIDCAAK